jgi:hypothetical protein
MQTELDKRIRLQNELIMKIKESIRSHVYEVNKTMTKAEILGCIELIKIKISNGEIG